ncbi:YolD-like family protein [Sporosarcina limicola]|uniref:YolD-like family protein n=1 Tax=Sporosarcina limicola TaxID=34101 RepID=A0A927MFX7_9BACL|nr:YolD-like family protein [Sporosarcina limicola]MBE1553865.1 hypothetical protein [Sporosarcina limicola]
MIRDCGTKKWTAMMLPEHVQQLREWQDEDKTPNRQQPHKQQFEEWNDMLARAMKSNTPLTITHWQSGNPFIKTGFIRNIDSSISTLRLYTGEGIAYVIPLDRVGNISEFE